jgi:hypothetical protein
VAAFLGRAKNVSRPALQPWMNPNLPLVVCTQPFIEGVFINLDGFSHGDGVDAATCFPQAYYKYIKYYLTSKPFYTTSSNIT